MYLDLTREITDDLPVFPGDEQILIKHIKSLEMDGYNSYSIYSGNHIGTHIDTPMHMIDSNRFLSEYPIENFIGTALVVDINSTPDEKINCGDNFKFLLFKTGMDHLFGSQTYYDDYPTLPDYWVDFVIKHKIPFIGLDSPSPDHYPYNIHKRLMREGVLIIENLTKLDHLPMEKEFKLMALPLKVRCDGAPIRVVAEL
jgi:kynurenine formamidase